MIRSFAVATTLLVLVSACGTDMTARTQNSADVATPPAPPASNIEHSSGATATGEISTDSDPGPDVAPTSTGANNDLIVSHGASVGHPQEELTLGDVKLWVSNQSFEDDPVAITIRINETVVVDDSFLVEGQHNWTAFDIAGLEPGKHQLTAESDTGAQLAGVFTLPENESRWLVVDYWFYVDEDAGRYFTFSESDERVAFA